MNLKVLSKNELDARLKTLVAKERELLLEVLNTIKEIDQRKIFLDFGYSSLFSYLTQGVGYSESSAYRRIEAARLLKSNPEVSDKIQLGKINLNQISCLQKTVRQVQKSLAKKVSHEDKNSLISQIENLNYLETEKCIAQYFDLPVEEQTKIKVQKDESVRLELTLTKDVFEKVKQAQALLAHSVPSHDLVMFLNYLAEKVIAQKTKVKNEIKPKTLTTSAAEVQNQNFSKKTKKLVLSQTQTCQFQDPVTKRICNSKWFLQVDHKHSRWAGGVSAMENAQVVCASHNQHKYRKESGLRFR